MHLNGRMYQSSGKLTHVGLPEITDPFKIKILWLRDLGSDSDPKAINKKPHKHSFYEAHFVLRGTVVYTSEDGEFVLSENCAVLFPPDHAHTVKVPEGDFFKISVAFCSESELFSKDRATFLKSERLTPEIDALFAALEEKRPFYTYLMRDRVFSLLTGFVNKDGAKSICVFDSCENLAVSSAKRYIDDNVHLFLTCEAVANYCHFNVKYLSRIFKEQTGVPMLTYIHSVKLKEAERLLAETDMSLSAVSAALGFENEYYFNTFFKRMNGITPGTYQKLASGKNK